MNAFTLTFLCALALGTTLELWLGRRQCLHVKRHRDKVPEAFADSVPLAAHHKAADYSIARLRLQRLELAFHAALLLFWTLGGGLQWFDNLWAEARLASVPQGTLVVLSILLLNGLIELPLAAYTTFGIESRFGFNRSTAARFIKDTLIQALLILLIGAPVIAAALWLMGSAGPLWWLAVWALWLTFTLAMTWAFPTFIAPLFNRFEPLNDECLRDRVQSLLNRCGFTSDGVFVMDGSRRSAHGNAYFTGIGKHKRIVLFDTLTEQLAPDEMEAVLAHELGHYKRRHVLKHLLALAVFSLAGLALLGWLSQQPWFFSGLGVEAPSHHMTLLLFIMILPVFSVFLQPLISVWLRGHEFEADDFALAHADPHALKRALVSLYRENASTLTPDPLYSAFHDSHPPAPVRIGHISDRMAT